MKGKAVRALQTELHSKMISVAFFFFFSPLLLRNIKMLVSCHRCSWLIAAPVTPPLAAPQRAADLIC